MDAREAWRQYYTYKRISHQWMQAHLLAGLPVGRVLEIGPYRGLVTAMLTNLGLDVTTLDIGPRQFTAPPGPHIEANLITVAPEVLKGFDAALCCETLEHLPWADTGPVLRKFSDIGIRWLVISVPYEGFQFFLQVYLNGVTARRMSQFRKLNRFRTFRAKSGMEHHQWEVGYRGFSLKRWERQLGDHGWRIVARHFSSPCRSVFHVLENKTISDSGNFEDPAEEPGAR